MAREVPFTGTPPAVDVDDLVEVRNAYGDWVPMVAMGPPRYDHDNPAGGVVHLTVPVALRAEWRVHGDRVSTVNWPAEDVRLEGEVTLTDE